MTRHHPDWGRGEEFFGPRHRYREKLLLSRLPGQKGCTLDIACGLGTLSAELKKRGHRVTGADGDFGAALSTHRRGIPTVVADLSALPFLERTADLIISAETLEHVFSHGEAAEEFHRILRAGGSVVLSVPAHPTQWSDWDEWAGHRRRYSFEELLLTFSGFLPVATHGFGFPLLRLYDALFLRRFIRRRHTEGDQAPGLGTWLLLKRLFSGILYLLFHLEIPSRRFNVGWIAHFMKIRTDEEENGDPMRGGAEESGE